MPRKKKYENSLIVKNILASEYNRMGDLQASLYFRFLNLKKKEDKEFLKKQIECMIEIFNGALKELEENK